ncbi:MAG: flagellar biosynthesis protein FlgA [Chloroflexi bacterium]|nr:flagellar biosynthesis protein FlgA [Chloroflexota bacterium]
MVNKEADVTVGPMLKRLADCAGLVYTAVDGDQHGLLMGMVQWARTLGLEVLSGGKARNAEFVYDPLTLTVTYGQDQVNLDQAEAEFLAPISPGRAEEFVRRRAELLGRLGLGAGSDLVEMAIAANATGLLPDVETLHAPVLRIREIPEVLSPRAEGGILALRGAVDMVTCLRHADGPGMGGGVFLVVGCDNAYSREMLTTKGLLPNGRGTTALIYRPHHLVGVETPMTVLLLAALGGIATGATEYMPRVDVVARAARDLRAGERLGGDHAPALQALVRPAQAVGPGAPLPLHLGYGNLLTMDVPMGAVITGAMVQKPDDSTLWALRERQDREFLPLTPPL